MGTVSPTQVAEGFQDQVTLDFLHSAAYQRGDAFRALLGRRWVRRSGSRYKFDGFRANFIAVGQRSGAVNRLLQLAHIAAPLMRQPPRDPAARDSGRNGSPFSSA